MISLETLDVAAARRDGYVAALLVMLTVLIVPTVHAQSQESAAKAAPAAEVQATPEASANPIPPAPGEPVAGGPNLAFQKFPAEFADYYTTQRLTGTPAEPRPFCKSGKPLLVDGHNGALPVQALLDESGGTGTGYDTLYIDSGDGDFASPVAYKVAAAQRKTGLGGRPLVGYFESVSLPRKETDGTAPHAQVFVEHDPTGVAGSDYVVNLIPAEWAVGTIQVNGQTMPVAMVDGAWSGNVASQGGLRGSVNEMAPGDDAKAMRGSYLILGKPGDTNLQPGDPNGWLGQGGSARTLNTQYLVLDSGVFEVQAEQTEGGVNLQLAPANVATSTIDLSQVPHGGRFAMFGASACVVLENPATVVQVPGDAYYVPAFGAYTVAVPAGGAQVTLPPPSDIDAASPQGYNPLADREQRLFAADPQGGAVQWLQPQGDPFAFSRRSWRTFQLQVVASDTRRPIRGAKVTVYSFTGSWMSGKQGERTFTTDEGGRCAIQVPGADLQNVAMAVQAAGFVPGYKQWGMFGGNTIPERYTWPAEPGTPIGGLVRDERDRPIRNVRVYVRAESLSAAADAPDATYHLSTILTDRQGKWKCEAFPAKTGPVRVQLQHADYISDAQPIRSVPIEKLRDMSAVLIMKQGTAVTGKVLGPKGTAVAGAKVTWPQAWGGSNSVKTDREGRFKIPNLPAGELAITVSASGCAPDQKKVTVGPDLRPVEFRLETGKTLKGRVVDDAGAPIPLVNIGTTSWRGAYNLQWTTTTDAQGRFQWTEAPADEVVFNFSAEGCMSDDRPMVAGADEQVIILKRNMTIHGRVVDARTGQPVKTFKAVLGYAYADGTTRWFRFNTSKGADGSFTLTPEIQVDPYRVRIEAEGYLPADSEPFSRVEPSQSLDFALTAGQDVTGIVVNTNGQPVAEAQVGLTAGRPSLQMRNGRLGRSPRDLWVSAGADGRFRLPAQIDDYTLVGAHEQGFGRVSRKEFEKTGRVRLEPWGRIEGVARRGRQPLVSQPLNVNGSGMDGTREWPVGFSEELTTDETGRFTIERAIPGILTLWWQVGEDRASMLTLQQAVEVQPGQTCRVELGGSGRTVKGRLQVAARAGWKIRWEYCSCGLKRLRPGPRVPASMPAGERAVDAWYEGWLKSEKGREYQLAERSCSFQPQADGAFEIPDVPAGKYVLSAIVQERREGSENGSTAGIAIQELEVPAMAGGRSDTPLDLGTITMKRSAEVKAGDTAPALAARTLEGKGLSLSQYRGKYVLLHFWASWDDETYLLGTLKNLHKQYGEDGRLVILGLSLDGDPEDAKDFARLNEMNWAQGHLGEWAKTAAPGEYGIAWLPYVVLVSPEGRIVVAGDSGQKLREELVKGLGKPSAPRPSTTQSAATNPSAGR